MTTAELQKMPQPGDTAPDFTARSTSGSSVTLSSFRDRRNVLLAFFPLAFTSTCTDELCDFTAVASDFGDVDVEVIPISVDAVPSLRAYKAHENLGHDLVSDFFRDISRAYGVMDETKFHSKRSYFLIDRSGTVRWAYVEAHDGLRRSSDEIMKEIRKLA